LRRANALNGRVDALQQELAQLRAELKKRPADSETVAIPKQTAKITGPQPEPAADLLETIRRRKEAMAKPSFVDDTSQTLESQGWHAAVRVREEGEQVRIYMKPAAAGGVLEGITLMVTDTGSGDEAVFINIAGAIEPAQLGKIAAAIGMNGMFNLVPGAAVGQNDSN
jgi:hypothetical protein